jgi:hypothetical protein
MAAIEIALCCGVRASVPAGKAKGALVDILEILQNNAENNLPSVWLIGLPIGRGQKFYFHLCDLPGIPPRFSKFPGFLAGYPQSPRLQD